MSCARKLYLDINPSYECCSQPYNILDKAWCVVEPLDYPTQLTWNLVFRTCYEIGTYASDTPWQEILIDDVINFKKISAILKKDVISESIYQGIIITSCRICASLTSSRAVIVYLIFWIRWNLSQTTTWFS